MEDLKSFVRFFIYFFVLIPYFFIFIYFF